MGDKFGPLSSAIVALLASCAVFVFFGIIIIAAFILDLPNRAKRRADTGIMEPVEKRSIEISEAEKGQADTSTTESSTTNQSTSYSSLRPTRPQSPVCTCEHSTSSSGVSPYPPQL